mgnify:CR=1 FL=1
MGEKRVGGQGVGLVLPMWVGVPRRRGGRICPPHVEGGRVGVWTEDRVSRGEKGVGVVRGGRLGVVSNGEFDEWMDESEEFQVEHSPKLYNIIGIHEKTFKIDGFYCLKTSIPDVILSKL